MALLTWTMVVTLFLRWARQLPAGYRLLRQYRNGGIGHSFRPDVKTAGIHKPRPREFPSSPDAFAFVVSPIGNRVCFDVFLDPQTLTIFDVVGALNRKAPTRSRPEPVMRPAAKWSANSISCRPGIRRSRKKPIHFPDGKRESVSGSVGWVIESILMGNGQLLLQ